MNLHLFLAPIYMDRHDELYNTYSKTELCSMIVELEDEAEDLGSKINELEDEVEVFERRCEERADMIVDLESQLEDIEEEDEDTLPCMFEDPLDTPILEVDLENVNPNR